MRRIAIALMFGLTFAACDSGDGDGGDDSGMFPDDEDNDDGQEPADSICVDIVACSSGAGCLRDEETMDKLDVVDESCVRDCVVEDFGAECGCPADESSCLERCEEATQNAITVMQQCIIDSLDLQNGECESYSTCEDDIFDPSIY